MAFSEPPSFLGVHNDFAPQSLSEYVGQEKAKLHAQIMVGAALKEARSLPNILIDASPGQGKTTLARLIMNEMGANFVVTDGTSVNGKPRSYFVGNMIIDEAHNLKAEQCDTLNISLDMGYFHMIGCTTMPGALPAAFRSRFRTIHLEPYTTDEIAGMLRNAAAKKQTIKINNDLLYVIAARSRRTPRTAIKYLSFALEFATFNDQREITMGMLEEVWDILGVDEQGLVPVDREYLAALPGDRPVGLQYLSAVLRVDKATIETEIEPYLLELGLIDRGVKGRERVMTDEERFRELFGEELGG